MPTSRIEVCYPRDLGSLTLRSSYPGWEEELLPTREDGDRTFFEIEAEPGTLFEFKLFRNGSDWSCGRNHAVLAGERVFIEPWFDCAASRLEPAETIDAAPHLEQSLSFEVLLPPSYDEHRFKRYPVLYALDGHALFSTSTDLFDGHSWLIDSTLDQLYELGAMQELIVVAIHTNIRRIELLSPMPDPHYGGGEGPRMLAFLAQTLKPLIDGRYRTLPGRNDTAILGSSMGGLFSFFAAWTRPDVFGRAVCMSSSFWWSDRGMIKRVQHGGCASPLPWLYIDSGAAIDPFEDEDHLKDGMQHSRAMVQSLIGHCYEPGRNLHSLTFPGLRHHTESWAARLDIPLQLVFPRRG